MTESETTLSWNWISGNDSDRARQLEEIADYLHSHPDRNLDHSPDWLESKAQAHNGSCRLCLHQDTTGRLSGYAPFFVHRGLFEFAYAGRTIARYSIQRYSLTSQPVLHPESSNADAQMGELLQFLRSQVSGREVVFLLGLHLDSPLGRLVKSGKANKHFLVMPHGAAYQRRRARVSDSLETYLAALGSKSRQDLRRQERRLLKQAGGDVTFSVFSLPAEVESFLAEVEKVSRLTYQWNLLGIGIRQQESTITLLKQAAHQGRFRGYILGVEDGPIAFMIGYVDAGTYYSESIGYHPDWAKYSAGNVLHLHVMRDLANPDRRVEWFDFMYGDNSNKERLSTDHHAEQNIYLVPKTARWRLIVGALRVFNALTDTVSSMLERYGLKAKIRRIMRSRATSVARRGDK